LHRLQVKYRSARAGAVVVKFRSMWADRDGTHTAPMDKSAIDAVCIYCPETDQCYYIRPGAHGVSVTLRIAPSKNGQTSECWMQRHFAKCHTHLLVDPNVCGVASDAMKALALSD
jgi:PD-(D/E)XK endonuclease